MEMDSESIETAENERHPHVAPLSGKRSNQAESPV